MMGHAQKPNRIRNYEKSHPSLQPARFLQRNRARKVKKKKTYEIRQAKANGMESPDAMILISASM